MFFGFSDLITIKNILKRTRALPILGALYVNVMAC